MKLTAVLLFATFLMATVATLRSDQLSEEEAEDFMTIMMRQKKEIDSKEALRTFFEIFDKDGDGYITSAELYKILKKSVKNLTENEVEAMIQMVDTNGDGKISIDELMKIMSQA